MNEIGEADSIFERARRRLQEEFEKEANTTRQKLAHLREDAIRELEDIEQQASR